MPVSAVRVEIAAKSKTCLFYDCRVKSAEELPELVEPHADPDLQEDHRRYGGSHAVMATLGLPDCR